MPVGDAFSVDGASECIKPGYRGEEWISCEGEEQRLTCSPEAEAEAEAEAGHYPGECIGHDRGGEGRGGARPMGGWGGCRYEIGMGWRVRCGVSLML